MAASDNDNARTQHHSLKIDFRKPLVYQIKLHGHLNPEWQDWFDGLQITVGKEGNTLLTGPVADQSALHGLFKKIRDLGMPLLAVYCFGTETN